MGLLRRRGRLHPLTVAVLGGDGFDWYVDGVNGDDANSGKSAGDALKTISALESAGISEGESIGLARGSHWREQLDIAVDDVTVEAYGSGDDPLLDASDEISSGDWSKTGGQTNVYEASVTADLDGNTNINVWENGTYLSRASDVADCDATPGSYYPSSDSVSPITLYIHPNGSTNPTSDGKIYAVSVRQHGIFSSGSGVTIDGIKARRNAHDDGGIKAQGANSTISNCQCEDGNTHNLFIGPDGLVEDCVLSEAYHQGSSFSMLIGYVTAGAGEDITIRNCTIGLTTYNSDGTGIFAHVGAGSLGTITLTGCTATNLGTGFNGSDATAMVVSNCATEGCGIGFVTEIPTTYTGCTYLHSTGGSRAFTINAAVAVSIAEFGMSINDAAAGGVYSAQAVDLTVEDGDWLQNDPGGNLFNLDAAGATIVANRNAYEGWLRVIDAVFASDAGGHASDHNCFESENMRNRFADIQYTNVTDYKAGQSQDSNSTVGSCDLTGVPS